MAIININLYIHISFRIYQVDKAAVSIMSDKALADLGVVAAGDRVKLRAFCQQQNGPKDEKRAEMKRKLTEILEASKSRRTSQTLVKKSKKAPSGPKKTTLKFELRWKHYVKGAGFKTKRSEQGGGVRVVDLSKDATANDCLLELKNTFFPNGVSPLGSADEMEFTLADFKCQKINMGDNFSAESYKKENRLSTPRLFLLTRDIGLLSEESDKEDLMESPFDSLSQRDALLSSPVSGTEQSDPVGSTSKDVKTLENSTKENEQANDEILAGTNSEGYTSERFKDGLIGTSEQRKALMDCLNADYQVSLAADKEKRLQQEADVRRESLRESRENRVLLEPAPHKARVTVSVRHPSLGIIKRAFPANCKVTALYDWVGSLCSVPEHFSLSFSPQGIVYPEEDISSVASSMLCMTQRDIPIPLCKDEDEVSFFNADCDITNDDTLPDEESGQGLPISTYEENDEDNFLSVRQDDNRIEDFPGEVRSEDHLFGEVPPRPPVQLLEEDPEISSGKQAAIQTLDDLRIKREMVKGQFNNQQLMFKEINRHNCFKELLTLYQEETIVNHELMLSMKDEEAAGDGVRREVYSVFWDSFISSYCEGCSHFTFSVSAALSQDDFVAIGRLLTHQFIQTGTIPLQISEAIVQQAVVGKVSEDCLIQSFLKLLHEKEREILQQAMLGKKPFPMEDVAEILSDYGVTFVPSASNIEKILLQVSQTELISKPFLYISKLREGMGPFWDDVTDTEIHALYSVCAPTPSHVLQSLELNVQDQQESRVSRWLTRYIKSKDNKLLGRFLRFSTGSDVLLPHNQIKVQFVNMSNTAMRPKAQTCFNILTLPKNYRTLAHLRWPNTVLARAFADAN